MNGIGAPQGDVYDFNKSEKIFRLLLVCENEDSQVGVFVRLLRIAGK